jgi:hypothetical protein
MAYDMRNYLYLIDYANVLPGTVEHEILEQAFEDSEIEKGDLSSITKNLKYVKSEDGVKMAIYMGIIKLSWTNEWAQFDNLLERIDNILDDMKIDKFLEKIGQFGS